MANEMYQIMAVDTRLEGLSMTNLDPKRVVDYAFTIPEAFSMVRAHYALLRNNLEATKFIVFEVESIPLKYMECDWWL